MLFSFNSKDYARVEGSVASNRSSYPTPACFYYWCDRIGYVMEISKIEWRNGKEHAVSLRHTYAIPTEDIAKVSYS